eukprot:1157426-Pelagomonas_calceolata.AAC.5
MQRESIQLQCGARMCRACNDGCGRIVLGQLTMQRESIQLQCGACMCCDVMRFVGVVTMVVGGLCWVSSPCSKRAVSCNVVRACAVFVMRFVGVVMMVVGGLCWASSPCSERASSCNVVRASHNAAEGQSAAMWCLHMLCDDDSERLAAAFVLGHLGIPDEANEMKMRSAFIMHVITKLGVWLQRLYSVCRMRAVSHDLECTRKCRARLWAARQALMLWMQEEFGSV